MSRVEYGALVMNRLEFELLSSLAENRDPNLIFSVFNFSQDDVLSTIKEIGSIPSELDRKEIKDLLYELKFNM